MLSIVNKRIPRFAKSIRQFVHYINSRGEIKATINLHLFNVPILDDDQLALIDETYDTQQDVVGIYNTATGDILVAVGALDCTTCLHTIAHEYCHAIQHSKNKPLKEAEADAYAANALINYQLG